MVEELLELFVTEVDADLLEGVEFENLKSGDVKDADEVDLWGKRMIKNSEAYFFCRYSHFSWSDR